MQQTEEDGITKDQQGPEAKHGEEPAEFPAEPVKEEFHTGIICWKRVRQSLVWWRIPQFGEGSAKGLITHVPRAASQIRFDPCERNQEGR